MTAIKQSFMFAAGPDGQAVSLHARQPASIQSCLLALYSLRIFPLRSRGEESIASIFFAIRKFSSLTKCICLFATPVVNMLSRSFFS